MTAAGVGLGRAVIPRHRAMSKYGGTVLKTSLSKAHGQELQDALHGGVEAAVQ